MNQLERFIQDLYENFNDRKIDLVIDKMTENVTWANGMEGGYVYGREGVAEYWTRQFKVVSSRVEPMAIKEENGEIIVKVHQIVHDLDGKLLADEIVTHIFYLENGKIAKFRLPE